MNKLQCRVCGGQIELQEDNRGICLNCGTSYSLGSMKKMFEGLKVSITGSSEDVEQWRLLLDKYYSAGDFTEAERVAKKILEADPSDEQTNLRYDELQVLKYFDVKNGVIKGYTGTARKIKIPNAITEIEAESFKNNQYIEEVWLPDTIKIIEERLFANCSNLQYVHLPDNLEAISGGAFAGCSALEKIEIPKSVSTIGDSAFSGCSALEKIEIPKSVSTIGDSAFSGCSKLNDVQIPETVKEIGGGAFKNCTSLREMAIAASITRINDSMFEGCSKLSNVEIPETVKSIGAGVFKNCISLREIVIPASVTELGSSAQWDPVGVFADCTSLERVDLNQGLETIGPSTFAGCRSLASIEIPFGVKSIGCGAFRDCKSLRQISIPDSVLSIETKLWGATDYTIHFPFEGCSNLEHIDYPYRFDVQVFSGSRFYIRMVRIKKGLCPECGGKRSLLSRRCSQCGKPM